MGKRNNQRKNVPSVDSDDDGSVSSSSTAMSELTLVPETDEIYDQEKSLDQYLDALYEKRGSTREKALSFLLDAFTEKLQHQFVENKFITLLHQCLNSIKRGSSKEIYLASRVIGLLALTVGCGDNEAHEILEESILPLSQALKSTSDSSKISSILECLAIITFVGGRSQEDTERSLQIIWQLIHQKSGSNVVANKPTVAVITTAISAWSFTITTMDECKANSTSWQESISYFSNLLDKDDRSVRIAAGEAIALLFELGGVEKFLSEAKGSSDDSVQGGNKSREVYAYIQGFKGKILNQVRNLSAEASGRGSAKKDLTNQKNLFRDVLEFLEDGYSPETSVKIGGDTLDISTWSQLIQLNFLKRFLGGGFVKHMQDNELLHDVFDFTPKRKNLPRDERPLSRGEKRMYKSPNSVANKVRTQLLNKQRMLSQGRNHGHFAISVDEA